MKLFTGFCVIAVLGAGLSLRTQTAPFILTAQAASPPPRVQIQGPPANSPSTPSPTGAVRVSGGVMAGRLVKKVEPEYPSDIEAEGSVVLHAIIGADGKVQHLSVISDPASLQALAVNAVQKWEYEPFEVNGQPTAVDTTIVVNFRR